MITGIDHLIIACADLDAATGAIEGTLGLRASAGGRHEAHGTANRLFWLGDSYIELMAVFDAALAGVSWWGQHVKTMVAERGVSGRLAGIPLSSDDLEGDVARLRAVGSAVLPPAVGERRRPDGAVVRWSIGRLPEPDPDLGLLFLIQHNQDAAEWRPEDRAARANESHPLGGRVRLVRVEVPVPEPADVARRLTVDLGLGFVPGAQRGDGALEATLGDQVLCLLPLRADGVAPTIVLRGGPVERQADLLGCRWLVTPA